MADRYFTPKQVVEYVQGVFAACENNYAKTAKKLGVSPALVWKLLTGKQKDSGLIRKKCNLPKPPRIRSQVTWESTEQRDACFEYIKARGYDGLTHYLRVLGDWQID